jgi:hypothetical protein
MEGISFGLILLFENKNSVFAAKRVKRRLEGFIGLFSFDFVDERLGFVGEML